MNLDHLKSSWKHYKLINSLQPPGNIEALIALEELGKSRRVGFQRILINLMLFLMLTIFIQGG